MIKNNKIYNFFGTEICESRSDISSDYYTLLIINGRWRVYMSQVLADFITEAAHYIRNLVDGKEKLSCHHTLYEYFNAEKAKKTCYWFMVITCAEGVNARSHQQNFSAMFLISKNVFQTVMGRVTVFTFHKIDEEALRVMTRSIWNSRHYFQK
jgi:hypothetical protein